MEGNVQRFRGWLVFKAHGLCVSLKSRLASNGIKKEEEADLDAEREGLVFEADGVPVGSVSASGKRFNFRHNSLIITSISL